MVTTLSRPSGENVMLNCDTNDTLHHQKDTVATISLSIPIVHAKNNIQPLACRKYCQLAR